MLRSRMDIMMITNRVELTSGILIIISMYLNENLLDKAVVLTLRCESMFILPQHSSPVP